MALKIGYISRRMDDDGEEIFKYLEANATRRQGVRSDTVKVKFLYGTYPYKEVKANTEYIAEGKVILVGEPFFTDDTTKEKMERWCEWANSCEHREYSLFGE